MFTAYLKLALRNLKRNRTFSFLNIFGLATGMSACIVILLFVFYEKSFDGMHHRNLYRINEVQTLTGMAASQKIATTDFTMGPTIKDEFPEILDYSRVQLNNQYEMTYGEKSVFFPQTYFVDSSFLRMFDFPILAGDRQTALEKPNSIVLTETAARELFGNTDVIGKTVSHYGEDTILYTVTGILKDVPANSQFQFHALQSFSTLYRPDLLKQHSRWWAYTYIELAPGTHTAALEKKFPAYVKKHLGKDQSNFYQLFLLRFSDIHAGSGDIVEDDINFQKFDKRYTNIFIAIGLLVLLIACINFMNLATAQSAERSKEVGIRKTIGALRVQLGVQFLVESALLSLISLVVALGMLSLVLPYVDKLSGRELSPLFFEHPGLIVAVLTGTILLGVLSGLYPAIYLSSFMPAKVLKGGSEVGKNRGTFRNLLVVGQFASAIFLIIATILVYRQVNYIMTQDPGFDRDQIVTIPLHGITQRNYKLMKQELSANPLVTGVTGAFDELGSPLYQLGFGFWPDNDKPMKVLFTTGLFVDADYLRVYKIRLVAGRDFTRESRNATEYIINETMARQLLKDLPAGQGGEGEQGRMDQPMSSLIGKRFGDSTGRIVGIAKDFNFNSLHYKIESLFLLNQTSGGFGSMSVKINGRQASQAIGFIESTWKKVFPEYPFQYQFLDDHFREIYRVDAQVSQMVAIMAGLAILISCLGLFGLASFSAERRTKEIGIRKVLGASVRDVVFLLSKHFIVLVLIANVIAWPLAWLALHRWIQDYAYRVAISWWVFVLAAVAALLIALATVSLKAVKAALSNPVEALRSE